MLRDIRLIHRLHLLSIKRSYGFDGGKAGKIFMAVIIALSILYVAFLGVVFGFLVIEDKSVDGIEFLSGIIPFLLVTDFVLRMSVKKIPAQQIKPFLLLPLSKYSVIDTFLIENLLDPYNLLWLGMFIPYGIITILPHFGVATFIALLIILEISILINSQWYLLVRTLATSKSIWWILPIVVYALMVLPFFNGRGVDFIAFLKFYASVGNWLWVHPIVLWAAPIALLIMLFVINVGVQHMIIRKELETVYDSPNGRFFGISLMKAKSEIELFMRVDIVSLFRIKTLRKEFINSFLTIIGFSVVIAFTNLLQDTINLWLYFLSLVVIVRLGIQIMSKEGNYIECLMVHKDSLVNLLTAKFYLLLIFLCVQFILILPTVIMGKYALGDVVAALILAGGLCNFICFQLAVYNNIALNFNSKTIGKIRNNRKYLVLAITMLMFIAPGFVVGLCSYLLPDSIADIVESAIGLAFIFTNRLWIKNIVRRMMSRKYVNIQGFQMSREQ